MNDWPNGSHAQRQGVPPQRPQYVQGAGPTSGRGAGPRPGSGYHQGQGYGSPSGGVPPQRGGGPSGPAQGPDWRRRIKIGSLVLVVVILATTLGTYFWADSKLRREVDLSVVIDRPAEGKGTNYLIVGTDSRDGMSDEEKKKLHTGSAEGSRTDSMMILHTGSNGPTLISLPRDTDVQIPSFKGSQSGKLFPAQTAHKKLNAAYAEDGAPLLVRTVEAKTGLRIDHYVEIGFAGFANVVDAIGGVDLDIPQAFKDKKSGADFQAGEQTLNGEQALAFVRTRYAFAGSDLDRTKNQQKFLAALAAQTATPSTIINPFRFYPAAGAGLDTLVVDKDMSLWALGRMFFAMKGVTSGDGTSMNMPLAGQSGGNLLWDEAKVKQLVSQLNNDEKVTVTGN
ncbi:LCP family protein [Streptomyces paludis]|uniref:LytR family transcriptional regulator n=1 Tax=Streptomyces paludis TaxID=2282738 RepID=A0A345HNB3_9ACTN|nr:LCP family protein [Streptomyces paludis]AXG78187.1 LytR family transcriptional regulator [Streptomyces paludis]